jgi:hypothetical protein
VHLLRPFLALVVLLLVLPAAAQAQATRTWVSGVGDDANPCSRTAPCKTWAGAITKTADRGEISALDPGGFGSVTITKSITLNGMGGFGTILASATNGVVVNAAADDDVILRDLQVNGSGMTICASPAQAGVRVLGARSVHVEDTSIEKFSDGVFVGPSAIDTALTLENVDATGICDAGVDLAPGAGRSVSALVRDATVTNSGTGLRAAAGATARVTGSAFVGNGVGVDLVGTGALLDLGGNVFDGNTTNRLPVPVAPPPPAEVRAPTPEPVVAPPAPPIAVKTAPVATPRCVVPSLVGLTLKQARTKLKAAGCAAGKVTYRKTTRRTRAGRVAAQRTKARSRMSAGYAVALTVWRRR